MPKSSPSRWIVIPPCRDFDFWAAHLARLAAEKGLSFAVGGLENKAADLVLTDNAEYALAGAVDKDHIACIISLAGPIAEDEDSLAPAPERHHNLFIASEYTRRAYQDLGGRYHLSDAFLKGPVALFDDLVLDCPDVQINLGTRRNKALLKAMDLYVQDRAIWSTEVLDIYAQEVKPSSKPRRFDATGKPRFIAHGPYLSMPKGQWKAVFRIEFDPALCDKSFRIDWGGVTSFGEFVFKPEKPGLYEIAMDWTWDEPSPCEIRLAALEGIFDGDFVFHDIEISRLA